MIGATVSVGFHVHPGELPTYGVDEVRGTLVTHASADGATVSLFGPDLESIRAFLTGWFFSLDTYEQNRAEIDAAWPGGGGF